MQILTFIILLLSSLLVSSHPVVERDITDVLSSLSTLKTDSSSLANVVATFSGNISQFAALDAGVTALKSSIVITTTSFKQQPSIFTYNESVSVTQTLSEFSRPVVNLLLQLVAKKPIMNMLGPQFTQHLHADLVAANGYSYDMFEATARKINLALFGAMDTSRTQIQAAFAEAIAAYV